VTSLERERKLDAPRSFALTSCDIFVRPYELARATWNRLHTVYYDTPDLRLTRWGVSLRFRVGDGWTVKLPITSGALDSFRTEHTFPGDRRTIPAEARDLVTAILRGATLEPIVEMRTIRTQRAVSAARGEVADIVEDDVRVVQAQMVVDRFRQIEIELRPETPDPVLDDLDRALHQAGAGPADPQPKVVIALGERKPDPEVTVPAITSRPRITDLVTNALASDVVLLVRLDPELRTHPTATTVHDARVSLRRLRSHLRTFRPVLEAAWAADLRNRLEWLGDVLSVARDSDVLLENLRGRAAALPSNDRAYVDAFLDRFEAQRARAYSSLAEAIRSRRYLDLIDALVAAAAAPRFNARAARMRRKRAITFMRPVWKRLRKRVRQAGASPHDRDLHRIRIASKVARYAAEALVPIVGRRVKRFAKRLEALQMLLGTHQDAVTAYHMLHRTLHEPLEEAFLAGEIAASETAISEKVRRKWRTVWNKVKRRRTRLW
jgi:CHAD domain-containing protein